MKVSKGHGTLLCGNFWSLRDEKEKQEDSVLAQRYRSQLPRRPHIQGFWENDNNQVRSVFVEKIGWAQ
ncbi:hypothetical protein [Flagellimonas marinaquae]|uniref:hypothetical protein n=1 Tax=Flagellimonas marinaquae TaxID=254955 RepID=UPI000F8EEB12|nr:hypothetical protein [Allomuricauda aquimarina]